jgi:hypothetical protein
MGPFDKFASPKQASLGPHHNIMNITIFELLLLKVLAMDG